LSRCTDTSWDGPGETNFEKSRWTMGCKQ
jgi:hypothetical protein